MALRSRHLIYGGNSYSPVDSGMSGRGVLYQVLPDDAPMLWYQYTGDGERGGPETGGIDFSKWAPRSGNQISRHWDNLQWVLALGNGTLLAVQGSRTTVARYDGTGHQDPDGSRPGAWVRGGVVREDDAWERYRFMTAGPLEGYAPFHITQQNIIGMDDEGGWYWYRYTGSAEPDPSRPWTEHWHPRSGTKVRRWPPARDYRLMAGIGDIIMTVDEGGVVQWHRYGGDGEPWDDYAYGPWHPNSGNVIGTGWQRYDHLFGGKDWTNGGYLIFAVDAASRDLHYFRYAGQGEVDQEMTNFVRGPRKVGTGW